MTEWSDFQYRQEGPQTQRPDHLSARFGALTFLATHQFSKVGYERLEIELSPPERSLMVLSTGSSSIGCLNFWAISARTTSVADKGVSSIDLEVTLDAV